MNTLIDTIQSLSLNDKRALVKTIKGIIADDLKDKKIMAVFKKQQKENAAKAKVIAQIKAAEEKLAKLQSKLAV